MGFLINPFVFGAGGGGDPNFGDTVLLMGFNGANHATSGPGFDDESSAAHGAATVTSAEIDTGTSVFGGSSALIDGFFNFGNSSDWNLSNQPFTIEFRYRPHSTSGTHFIINQWGNNPQAFAIYQVNDTLSFHVSTDGTNDVAVIDSGSVLVANTWCAFCLDFDGTKYRMYLDGTMIGSSTSLSAVYNSTHGLFIGAMDNAGFRFFADAHIDELRWTKVERYADDGGYTLATAEFPRS